MDRVNIEVDYAVSLKNLSKVYENTKVVKDVTIDLVPGEFLSLLGPSGSGKTTILRMIAGLTTLDGGKLLLNNKDATHIPPNKRNLGMVFQQYAIFPHMTVWENVAYGLKVKKVKGQVLKDKVNSYLELVDLLHLSDRKINALSGGQQQRVSLARALAVEPVVMLFDEPLSNLDVRLKEQMINEILILHKKIGFTAVYVTHDQNEALYLSDKIAVLNKGEIEQLGTPEELISKPATPFVADFFGFTNCLEDAVLINSNTAQIQHMKIPLNHVGEGSAINDVGKVLLRASAVYVINGNDTINPTRDNDFTERAYVIQSRFVGGQTELKLKLDEKGNNNITVLLQKLMKPLPKEGSSLTIRFDPDNIAFYKD